MKVIVVRCSCPINPIRGVFSLEMRETAKALAEKHLKSSAGSNVWSGESIGTLEDFGHRVYLEIHSVVLADQDPTVL